MFYSQLISDIRRLTDDPIDDHRITLLEVYFLRARGWTFMEMVAAPDNHEMFEEDSVLREMAKWAKIHIAKRVAELMTIVFPEMGMYPSARLTLRQGTIFREWLVSKNMDLPKGTAPCGQPCRNWSAWIVSQGSSLLSAAVSSYVEHKTFGRWATPGACLHRPEVAGRCQGPQ